MKYEETQKGNPYALTVRQHVFPKKSIERFVDDDGCVSVLLKKGGLKRFKPSNQVFCAMRSWDEVAEHGYMKRYEDQYQCLIDRLYDGDKILKKEDHEIISRMFVLWALRFDFANDPCLDVQTGLKGGVNRKDHEEILEKNGYKYVRDDGKFPGRQIASIRIHLLIDQLVFPGVKWGIIKSKSSEFIVPDTFGGCAIIPVNPKMCLIQGYKDEVISKRAVKDVNTMAVSRSINYVFARSFNLCPMG